jgi:hypothetical protein
MIATSPESLGRMLHVYECGVLAAVDQGKASAAGVEGEGRVMGADALPLQEDQCGGEEVGTAIKLPCSYVRCFVVLSYGEFFTVGMKRVAGSVLHPTIRWRASNSWMGCVQDPAVETTPKSTQNPTFVGFSTLKRLLWTASFELCALRKRDLNFQNEM